MILFYEKVPDKQSRGDDYGQDRHGRPVFFDSRRFLRSFKFQYRRCLAYRAIRNSLYLELVGLFFNADQGIGTIKLIGLSWREYRFAEQDDAVIMIAYFLLPNPYPVVLSVYDGLYQDLLCNSHSHRTVRNHNGFHRFPAYPLRP